MPALPNSHEALLKNHEYLHGRLAVLGPSDISLIPALGQSGLVLAEHYGLWQRLNSIEGWRTAFGYDDPVLAPACADTVVVFLPKARAELALRLELARWLAEKGARLILVGEKKEGIAGAVKQLRTLAPQAIKVDSARHCQVWLADNLQPAEAFDVRQWLEWHPVECAGVRLDVAALPGIFSAGELDAGTAMLLGSLADLPVNQGVVLDFACGAGVIGAWLQLYQRSRGQSGTRVDGVDVQSQAVICARSTYERAAATGDITASDGLDRVHGKYTTVLSNPPFHTGIRTDTSMTEQFLRQVAEHLEPGGELRLVANSFLPYAELIRRYVGPVRAIASDRRFTVWSARRQ
ncbi:methyltransferase [Marinobacter orientalis]|uniref:Ribosomal RNA small subunit methyltransferase C n=1 Tax=Marinobacter orientalis TaxID=1928859 RepID=A0A7Y0WTC2_9GAMM|nr:methyltransferase [Marinobacter orientalis]NMT64676.1 class I SAM-dependent methyltransferase [Marinobacter orientalis]TGX48289.1 class I SAM-dependent methyltransferase [Marinobacter orientalis]